MQKHAIQHDDRKLAYSSVSRISEKMASTLSLLSLRGISRLSLQQCTRQCRQYSTAPAKGAQAWKVAVGCGLTAASLYVGYKVTFSTPRVYAKVRSAKDGNTPGPLLSSSPLWPGGQSLDTETWPPLLIGNWLRLSLSTRLAACSVNITR